MLKEKDVKKIVAAVKAAGVTIEDTASVKDALEELELDAGESIPDGMKLISNEDFKEIKGDLVKLRRKKNELKGEIEELENAGGTSSDEMKTLKHDNEKLSKLVEVYLKPLRERWQSLVKDKSIPEKLAKYYTEPGKGEDGKPLALTDDQILANLAKYDEHVETGAIKPDTTNGTPPGGPPRTPPAGGDGERGDDKVYGKDAAKVMEKGYGEMPTNVPK